MKVLLGTIAFLCIVVLYLIYVLPDIVNFKSLETKLNSVTHNDEIILINLKYLKTKDYFDIEMDTLEKQYLKNIDKCHKTNNLSMLQKNKLLSKCKKDYNNNILDLEDEVNLYLKQLENELDEHL